MMGNPQTDPEHAARMISSLRCQAEVFGYEAEAKSRGISGHEIALLEAAKQKLRKAKKWNPRWQSPEQK